MTQGRSTNIQARMLFNFLTNMRVTANIVVKSMEESGGSGSTMKQGGLFQWFSSFPTSRCFFPSCQHMTAAIWQCVYSNKRWVSAIVWVTLYCNWPMLEYSGPCGGQKHQVLLKTGGESHLVWSNWHHLSWTAGSLTREPQSMDKGLTGQQCTRQIPRVQEPSADEISKSTCCGFFCCKWLLFILRLISS